MKTKWVKLNIYATTRDRIDRLCEHIRMHGSKSIPGLDPNGRIHDAVIGEIVDLALMRLEQFAEKSLHADAAPRRYAYVVSGDRRSIVVVTEGSQRAVHHSSVGSAAWMLEHCRKLNRAHGISPGGVRRIAAAYRASLEQAKPR